MSVVAGSVRVAIIESGSSEGCSDIFSQVLDVQRSLALQTKRRDVNVPAAAPLADGSDKSSREKI